MNVTGRIHLNRLPDCPTIEVHQAHRLKIEGHQQREIEEGFTIRSLPTNQGQLLALDAPEMWVGSPISMMPPLGGPEIYGAPAMVIEMTQSPVFFLAEDKPSAIRFASSGPLGQLGSGIGAPLFQGLSLACDSPVSASCAWSKFPVDVQSFVPWARLTANHAVLYGSGTGVLSTVAHSDR